MVEWQGTHQASVMMCGAALVLGCVSLLLQGAYAETAEGVVLAVVCFLQSTGVKYVVSQNRTVGWDTWWVATPSRAESMGVLAVPLMMMGAQRSPENNVRLNAATMAAFGLCALRIADRFSSGAIGSVGASREALLVGLGFGLSLTSASTRGSEIGVGCCAFAALCATMYYQVSERTTGAALETSTLRCLGVLVAVLASEYLVHDPTDSVRFLQLWACCMAAAAPVINAINLATWEANSAVQQYNQNPGQMPSLSTLSAMRPQKAGPTARKAIYVASMLFAVVFWYGIAYVRTRDPFSIISEQQAVVYVLVTGLGVMGFNDICSAAALGVLLFDAYSPAVFYFVAMLLATNPQCLLQGASLAMMLFLGQRDQAVMVVSAVIGLLQLAASVPEIMSRVTPAKPTTLFIQYLKPITNTLIAMGIAAWLLDNALLFLLSAALTLLLASLSAEPKSDLAQAPWTTLPYLFFFHAIHYLLESLTA